MTAEWRFERKRRSQKTRDPMQASFFTNASIDDDTHALVREAIQNSLDAKLDRNSPEPVHVRFHIGVHTSGTGVLNRYVSPEAWRHFNAPDNGLLDPPNVDDDCRFLAYEDFETHGLIGDERASEAASQNAFYYFMRAEGQSGKEDGERGRHGIGKYVFPYTSRIRMFIAATVRSSDGRCLVAGQCVLKAHTVAGTQFTPDGWWGNFEKDGEDDYFQLPVEDITLFTQLKTDFNLERSPAKPGLSLIVPFVREEVTAAKLAEHVIREYFWPILKGQLTVSVSDQGLSRTIDAASLKTDLDSLLPEDKVGELAPLISLALIAQSESNFSTVELSQASAPSSPKWNKDYCTTSAASTINGALYTASAFIRVRCPLYVHRNQTGETSSSHFDIYLAKDTSDTPRKPLFIREGISIPEDRVPSVRGYLAVIVIEPGDLATLLGDAENPAHTEWEKNATKFKGKYKWGPSTIDFVRLAVAKLTNLLSQGDEEEDFHVLSDIFYLDLPENEEDVPESRRRQQRRRNGPDPEPPPNAPPPAAPRYYRLSKVEGGFVLRGPKDPLNKSRSYRLTVAYDISGASKARALRGYHKNDFELAKAKNVGAVITDKVTQLEVGSNHIAFVASTNEFHVEVTGFDRRRDIIVDVVSEAATDEAI